MTHPIAHRLPGLLLILLALNTAACTRHPMPHSPQKTADQSASMPMDHDSMPHDMTMNLGPKDADFDLRFIDAMIPHHQGAVVMAQDALEKSQRPEIRQLAQAIIDAQAVEISQMQTWRQTWYPDAAATPMMYDASMGHMMPMSDAMRDSMMMTMDLGSADADFDRRFIAAMVPHHQGALEMAQQVLENSDRPELRDLATNILKTQQTEIDQMQTWQKAWYGE